MATAALTETGGLRSRPPTRARSSFHAIMALVILAGMIAGFSLEMPKYVFHPTVQRPVLLLVHSIVFTAWLILYVVQTLLVRYRNVRLHRMLGWAGLGLALVMPPLGIATAIVMRRFDIVSFHSNDMPRDLGFLATTFADIVIFTACVWLGLLWRRRPDRHRRLMFLSTAAFAEIGFGRLPLPLMGTWFYLSNLPFFAAAVVHDRVTTGRVHMVYKVAIPMIVLVEGTAQYLWLVHPNWWVAVCRRLTGFA